MTENNCITTLERFKHLNDIQRGRLEELSRKSELTQAQIAKVLGVIQSTISREQLSFMYIKEKKPKERVPCTKTVYALINQGALPVRNFDLPMKPHLRPRKEKRSEPRGKNAKHLSRSIDERDESVLLREERVIGRSI